MSIEISDFGKDHWSLMAYVGTLCQDAPDKTGVIDKRRIRSNPATHPIHVASLLGAGRSWSPEYGTQLHGYRKEDGSIDETRHLDAHDDWDCLDDLEEAGLIEIISEVNGFIQFTVYGLDVLGQLTIHKADGGKFIDFSPKPMGASAAKK